MLSEQTPAYLQYFAFASATAENLLAVRSCLSNFSHYLRCGWERMLRLEARAPARGPAEHLGRLAPCPPSAVFARLLAG